MLALRHTCGKKPAKGFTMFHLLGVILAINTAQAQSWDLGYTSSSPVVEEIPDAIDGDTKADIIEVSDRDWEESAQDQEKPPVVSAPVSRISTAKNTFGVQTIEKAGPKIFLSPVVGMTSILGNGTVNVTPQYAFGGRAGLLVSDSMMIEGGFRHSVINTSTPINLVAGMPPSDVFALKQNVMDVGIKFFFLGRESRFRPFIGGGLAYANSTLNLTTTYSNMLGLTDDYKIKQLQGLGQIGAEIAITRAIVATASFQLNGILSSSTESIQNENLATGIEANKVQAGNSLSRSASYTGTVGVGVYF